MIERVKSAFSAVRIQRQMFIVFFLTIVVAVLLLGSFLVSHTLSVQYERAFAQLESDNLRAKSILFDATLNFYNITEELIADKEFLRILSQTYRDDGNLAQAGVYDRFKQILINNTSISALRVYSTNPTIREDKFIRNTLMPKAQQWLDTMRVPGSSRWESSDWVKEDGLPELTLVRSIPLVESTHKAVIVIGMSNNYLKNRIQNNELFTSLSVEHDPVFYSTTRALQGRPEAAPIDYNKRYYQFSGDISYHGSKAYAHISSLIPYKTGQMIYITSLDFHMPGYIVNITILCCSIILLAILLPFLIVRAYARNFSSRVDMLKNAMHHARNGDYDIIDTFQGDDELSITFSDLKGLIDNIKKQQSMMFRSQIKEQELRNKQQDMEFKLLASQINPHFVYNTLETIRMMAIEEEQLEIAQATKIFANTMRYVLENTGTAYTTLDKEIDYIESYLAIHKLRFFDRVNYRLIKPDDFDLRRYQILPLLIQPLIENAILHGLAEVDGEGWIILTISPGQQTLIIDVEDNGRGIGTEELSRLNRRIDKGEAGLDNIGIYNIVQRIRLFYGEEYGLELTSDKWTRARLRLPLLVEPSK